MPKSEITSLSIGYSGGMEIESNFTYSVSMDDEGYHLEAILNSGNLEINKKISKRKYQSLTRLFDDVDLASCDDSDYADSEMALDTARLYFSASFSDGTVCRIHHMPRDTKGYPEAVDAFKSMFKKIIK